MSFDFEPYIQILAAFAAGATLGLEREYHNKPAGFRTIILITVSSCLFTILSHFWGGDRVAANILTGIGFIGAGVVFKEGVNVKGITSAAIVWMAAAIGMCIGMQQYLLAAMVVAVVIITLLVLFKFETVFDTLLQRKNYEIHFAADDYSIEALEAEFDAMQIKYHRAKISKQLGIVCVEYTIEIHPGKRNQFEMFLINNARITGFDS